MKLELRSTLGAFAKKSRNKAARCHLVAHCGHCDVGRRVDVATLIDFYGPDATFDMAGGQMVCPSCSKPARQHMSVLVFE